MKYRFFVVAAALSSLLFSCGHKVDPSTIDIIPLPAKMELQGGIFIAKDGYTPLVSIDSLSDIPKEGYKLVVNSSGATISASTAVGAFYALQSFDQLNQNDTIPTVVIEDVPRFPYRGLHLDVSRHFYPKEFVLKLIDEISYYKLNRLHLHLTDSPGWRMEIESYPKLTSIAAFRDREKWEDWTNDKDGGKFVEEGSENAHGGYYTKDDLREVVAYASERGIVIIPEIELPGHSMEVMVAYPELGCSGIPYKSGDFCIGNEATFEFVEKVLSEVIEVFPSEYIHIGGDEAGKGGWKTCPKCQKRMKDEGLKDVDELQSYMIKRVEKFLISKGRRLLGWDEILEGGLAPEATVMSWRGEQGGITAARSGHDVIMTPGSALYLDHYQADPHFQPKAIGGYLPIKTVYDYDPVPADSLTAEQQANILGAQGNLWTEWVPTKEHAEYMIFPRILAVAEMTWTPQELRDWSNFKPRVNSHVLKLQDRGVNAFSLSYDIESDMEVDRENSEIVVALDAEKYPALIRYTLDGTTPTAESPEYAAPIVVKDSAHIVAAIFEGGVIKGNEYHRRVDYHKAVGAGVKYLSKLYGGYMAGGKGALVDGFRGGKTYQDGHWQGYTNSLECVVDLGSEQDISKVSSRYMELKGPGVFLPGDVEYLISSDGENFESIGKIETKSTDGRPEPIFDEYSVGGEWKGRYVKVKASEVHNHCFIFIDEIVVW